MVSVGMVASAQHPRVQIDTVLPVALAPWWKRFLAIVIDSMVIGVAFTAVFGIIGALADNSNGSNAHSQPLTTGQAIAGFVTLFVLALVPNVLYFGIMNGSRRGQTLGKMALSIAVRDARTGGPIGVGRGMARSLVTTLFYVLLLVPFLIDNLSPLWDGRRQAWHDHVVRSLVVDLNP